MQTPIMLAHPWIHFDGILAHLVNRELCGQDYWTLPSKRPVKSPAEKVFNMPLKRTADVYHASVSFFDTEEAGVATIYKRFWERQSDRIHTRKTRVDMSRGLYKAYMMRIPYVPAKKIVFYVCGDLEETLRLLSFLPGLGKKVVYGFGAFNSVSVKEIDEDYSFVKDGCCMRPIPIDLCVELGLKSDESMMLAYKPPYWDKRLVKPCVPPGAKFEFNAS